eukprot:scaffold48135_cov22-Tisochrysis_lutea.AAC.1
MQEARVKSASHDAFDRHKPRTQWRPLRRRRPHAAATLNLTTEPRDGRSVETSRRRICSTFVLELECACVGREEGGGVRFGRGEVIWGRKRTCIPDFDRLVPRAGHDLAPVRGKRDRRDRTAMGVGLLAPEL